MWLHTVFQLKVPMTGLAGELCTNVAGCGTVYGAPAVVRIILSPFESAAITWNEIVSPAKTQVSCSGAKCGGLLLQTDTSICISRTIVSRAYPCLHCIM